MVVGVSGFNGEHVVLNVGEELNQGPDPVIILLLKMMENLVKEMTLRIRVATLIRVQVICFIVNAVLIVLISVNNIIYQKNSTVAKILSEKSYVLVRNRTIIWWLQYHNLIKLWLLKFSGTSAIKPEDITRVLCII